MESKVDEIDITNQVIIITGANTGIGYETALELARRGAQVILAVRNKSRGIDAAKKIIQETKNNKVTVEEIDLADFESIRRFAETFKNKYGKLNTLINNGGVFMSNYEKTKNGFEMHFGVNHLGHFLLTNLLLDLLKISAPSRIINISSDLYKIGKINWDDVNLEKSYGVYGAYAQSKLANVLFTLELAKRLKDTGVTAVSLTPGYVHTEITKNYTGILAYIEKIIRPYIALSAQNGAKTSVYCAISNDIPNHSGEYYNKCKAEKIPDKIMNRNESSRLWELSEKLVGL